MLKLLLTYLLTLVLPMLNLYSYFLTEVEFSLLSLGFSSTNVESRDSNSANAEFSQLSHDSN